MKILMCHKFHFIQGGTERYLFDLCQGLQSEGSEIFHFSMKDCRNFESQWQKYFVENVDYGSALEKDWLTKIKIACGSIYSFEAKKKIESLIEQFKPDIAHIHNIYHQISPSILHVFQKRSIPVVMTLHDYKLVCPNYSLFCRGHLCEKCRVRRYYYCFFKKCLKDSFLVSLLGALEAYYHDFLKIYKKVDLFIAPSEFMYQKIRESGIERKKILYLPCAIDLSQFFPKYAPGKYILYVGRLSPEKGIGTFIASLKHLPMIPVKLLGDGPQRKQIKQIVLNHGLSQVEFLGYRPKEDICQIMRDALCVVVPSEWYEPAGLVIYEAFASGKCVIASRIGGIPELVEDGVNGLLFEAGNARELVKKIEYLIEHLEKAEAWGENGYLKIKRLNDLKAHSMRMSVEYNKLLGRKLKRQM